MIRIRRSIVRKIGIAVAVTVALGVLALIAGYLLFVRKAYVGAIDVSLHPDAFIGRQIRVRGYLGGEMPQTITDCNPSQQTSTSFRLQDILLMDCEVADCTMTCPLFMPTRGAYEVVGTLSYCSNERLCLINIRKVYRLQNPTEELYGGQRIPITLGPVSFPVGQQ
jgi:hypothetical protein